MSFGGYSQDYALDSEIDIRIGGFSRVFFDKKELKKAIRKSGVIVLKEARRLIANTAISSPGEFPGKDTGIMMKSLKIKMGSGGGYAKVQPYKTPAMVAATRSQKNPDGSFYPQFLIVGTSRGLAPRKDFMISALESKRLEIRAALLLSLRNSLHGVR